MTETPDIRLRRLRMRSWRRGMREMDLLLGPFADGAMSGLTQADLDRYEALLNENDPDLWRWVSGGAEPPPRHREMLALIARFHGLLAY